jgi:hypothetical protein
MPKRPEHVISVPSGKPRRHVRAFVALVLLVMFGTASLASSAQLNVNARRLGAYRINGGPVVVGDNFATNGNLAGQTTPSGQVWQLDGGGWDVNNGNVRSTSTSATSSIVVQTGLVDQSVTVTIRPLGSNPRPGISFNDDGPNAMIVEYAKNSSGTLTLYTFFGSTKTAIASATGIGGIGSPFVLRVVSQGTTISVSVNGTLRFSIVLNAGQACSAKHIGCAGNGLANTKAGLFANNDTTSTFSSFTVGAP